MLQELVEVRQKRFADTMVRSKGYILLPLLHPSCSTVNVFEGGRRREVSLYPSFPPMDDRVNRRR